MLEHNLSVRVAASLLRCEPLSRGLGGGEQCGGHCYLSLEARADVNLVDLHQRLVQVVLHRHLEAFTRLQLKYLQSYLTKFLHLFQQTNL